MRWLGPWSASSGAQSNARATPPPSSTTAARANRKPLLFRNDVLKGGPGKYGEDGVVEGQEGQIARRIVGDGRTDTADDDRNRNRKEEQGQEQLARPAGHGHGGEERADGADPDVGQQDGCDRRAVHGLEKERERGQRDDLDEDQERERGGDFSDPDRTPVAGGEDERIEHALLALGNERPAEPEQRGEHDRNPEQALRRALLLVREREA